MNWDESGDGLGRALGVMVHSISHTLRRGGLQAILIRSGH
jgi:hypothetical protein